MLHGIDQIFERYGWNGKFFLLTRDYIVEITTVGGNYEDVDIHEKGSLFHYANQWFERSRLFSIDEIDRFGRCYLDRVFIDMCIDIYDYVYFSKPQKVFKSLTTRKDGDKYIVRVQYDDVDLEMEVEEMHRHFAKLIKEEIQNA